MPALSFKASYLHNPRDDIKWNRPQAKLDGLTSSSKCQRREAQYALPRCCHWTPPIPEFTTTSRHSNIRPVE
eukprot:scaffold1996_cov377-Prasinococcus_capsulatus_cf.AAC.8